MVKKEGQDSKVKNSILIKNLTLDQLTNTIKDAIALNDLGQLEEAISWYDKALEIDPNDVGALYNKGNILSNLERYEEAIFWYDKALEIDPTHVGALYNRRLAMEKIGKHFGIVMMSQKQLD